MKKILMALLLLSVQNVSSHANQKIVRYWPMAQPSVFFFNAVRCASYFFKMLPYVCFADEYDGKDESYEASFFLVCLHCNAIVPAQEVLTESVAKMFYAVSNQNLFRQYCKLMDRALEKIKKKNYKMFISCSFDGAMLAKRACRLCNKMSWQVMQKKDIDFSKVTSDRA